jgi:hypothetical protein
MKTHGRDYFYKYMSADVCISVLETLRVRWSSPRAFNDPFDFQMDLRFPFTRDELKEGLIAEIERVVFSDDVPVGLPDHEVFHALKIGWEARAKLPREAFMLALAGDIRAAEDQSEKTKAMMNQALGEFLSTFKVYCVVENPDNLLMWAHYGDGHTGAVLGLKCIPEEDTALCAAVQITYQDELPVVADLGDWVKRITGQRRAEEDVPLFHRLALTKSSHWAYEREWRVFTVREGRDSPDYVELALLPEEVDSVFLGCKVARSDRDRILRCIHGRLEHVKVFQAQKSSQRFAIELVRVR